MSLFGALQTGVAGLDAQSSALSVTSANIANVNTVGYKDSESQFETLLAGLAGGDNEASVKASASQNVIQQGLISSTNSATDLAISGNGFFVVSPSTDTSSAQSLLYTRAGNFTPDANGDLQNAAGLYLMGWPVNSTGSVPTDRNDLVPINVNDLSGTSEPTTTMSLQANLQASTTAVTSYGAGDMSLATSDPNYVAPDFQRTISVYDSQGGQQPLQVNYVKTGADSWSYEVNYQGDASNISTGNTPPNLLASGTITFNADGTLANVVPTGGTGTPVSGSIALSIPWDAASGLQSQPITLNMGTVGSSSGVTQYDSASTLVSSNVDGALFGSLTGVTIDQSGFVTANFSNGLSQKIYKIPLATFTNPDGLTETSGNAYQQSETSGTATVNEASQGGAGQVDSSSLETSTVDLATEFTNLITTQRAYQASAQIITTASTMLDDLLQQVH
ncbi:MAG: flagellar hook protein FlgE [Rhizomicrobium sp.]